MDHCYPVCDVQIVVYFLSLLCSTILQTRARNLPSFSRYSVQQQTWSILKSYIRFSVPHDVSLFVVQPTILYNLPVPQRQRRVLRRFRCCCYPWPFVSRALRTARKTSRITQTLQSSKPRRVRRQEGLPLLRSCPRRS